MSHEPLLQMIRVSDEGIRALKALTAYAIQPENWFRPPYATSPGTLPEFVRTIVGDDLLTGTRETFRVVFTYSVLERLTTAERPESSRALHRHASVSMLDGHDGLLPAPLAVFTICKHLGFTGSSEDWQILSRRQEGIVGRVEVVQPLSIQPTNSIFLSQPQWWGPLDGTLHLFEGVSYGVGSPIRTSQIAACGWHPDTPLLEMPEDLTPERICAPCRKAAHEMGRAGN